MALLPADDEDYTVETRKASPAHLLIKIESFSKLSKHGIRKLKSTEFEAGDYRWKLTINLDEDDHISAYLSMIGTTSLPAGWEVNAIFNFFLYDHFSDNYLCFRGKAWRFHAMKSEWGFSNLMTKKSLREACNGYIFKDRCVFGAEVFVIEKKPLIQNVSLFNLSQPCKRVWKISNFSKLNGIWKSEELFAGGYKWNIVIYPNANGKACGSHVSIFLKCVDAKSFGDGKKVYACCHFCLRNKLSDKKDHSKKVTYWFTSIAQNWGFPEFKEIGDMRDPIKGFVVDDCCTLETQLSVLLDLC